MYVCGHARGSLDWVFFHNLGPRDQTLSELVASILPLNYPASQHGAAVSFFICKGQLARASLRLRCELYSVQPERPRQDDVCVLAASYVAVNVFFVNSAA